MQVFVAGKYIFLKDEFSKINYLLSRGVLQMEQARLLKAHEEKQKEVQIVRHDYEIQLEVLKAKEIALENRLADLARREQEQRESEALLKFKELFV